MKDVDRAISEIADIRARLAASTRFHGITAKATALTGFLALALAGAQTLWPHMLARDTLQYVAVWAGFLIASIAIVALEAIARSRRLHGRMSGSTLQSTLRLTIPFVAAGTIITLVTCKFAPDSTWILPGLWQILVALVGFSVLPSMPRTIVWPACWYLICGSIVLTLGATNTVLSPWMMGIPFAIGQPAVALILYHRNGERDDRA